ncbi:MULTISPECIES: hypothetical protein [unclassified Paenibacillus]|uniref:hypothetical protein n=1 Tax=unclassified Paenibacillus TaxID=185978 RepID=UPI0024076C3C|nr:MULTISPECIES: hypothetical protein [unclassified Paenibacillus]MDF9843034.1 hypothetical protein [Paenibacillus sp. PastF-2]MDF9849754.1 hypothetical protein [Paenibacillus sp. PastM-2]MDF9856329.1 hypothetical protein [Paenibacillus sp. PastF-1]MDH6481600.1 hypothetical protein [Paenibacillus sp. PastH-2]MDH6508882.1 hypothetical protein [Paenibacillus sp. PastM-3]
MKNDIIDLYDYSNLSEADLKAESIEGKALYYPKTKKTEVLRETPGHLCFWRFPDGRGRYQSWRRRLWELQNNRDGE